MDPLWRPPTAAAVRDQLQSLLVSEKALLSKVKDRERDMQDLLAGLHRDKHHYTLEKSVYDLAYEQSVRLSFLLAPCIVFLNHSPLDHHYIDHSQKEEKNRQSPADAASANTANDAIGGGSRADGGAVGSTDGQVNFHDYLAPFLAQFPAGKPLSRKQAMQVKEECLKALKERLLERANIIQAHLDTENELLRQRQALHERAVAALSAATQSGAPNGAANIASLTAENEEYSKFYEESMFRISILQARLARVSEALICCAAAMVLYLTANL